MKIGILHFRCYETDGVSLEMDKWGKAIELLGHEAFIIAGNHPVNGSRFFEFREPEIEEVTSRCFSTLQGTEEDLRKEIEKLKNKCYQELERVFQKTLPDVVVVNNIFSLPINIPLTIALTEYLEANKTIKCIGFQHDFFWERDYYTPTCEIVNQILERYFPPSNLDLYLVLNSIAQKELYQRRRIHAEIVDNYFDFEEAKSYKSEELKKELKIELDDFVVLHATRIVKRKAIELALEFCYYLGKVLKEVYPRKELKMVFPGLIEDDPYYKKLLRFIDSLSLNVTFVSELCSSPDKPYTLWDFYEICDLVTYTSVLEGWGNQFVEALAFRKLPVVYEYPVFKSDIKKYGFEYVFLGSDCKWKNGFLTLDDGVYKEAVWKTMEILKSPGEYQRIVDKNYKIAYENFSIHSLANKISNILQKIS